MNHHLIVIMAIMHLFRIAANDELTWQFTTGLEHLGVLVLNVLIIELTFLEWSYFVGVVAHQVCMLLI